MTIDQTLLLEGDIEKYTLNSNEKKICGEVGNYLSSNNIFFAGIDMIGEKITEINITSPTCIAEINKIHDIDVGKIFGSNFSEI